MALCLQEIWRVPHHHTLMLFQLVLFDIFEQGVAHFWEFRLRLIYYHQGLCRCKPSSLSDQQHHEDRVQYQLELELEYTSSSCTDTVTVKATAVLINIGDAVYRENNLGWPFEARGHAALVTGFLGGCSKDNLEDASNFQIIEMKCGGPITSTLNTMTNASGKECWGCFTKSGLTYSERVDIVFTAKGLLDEGIGWCDETLDYYGGDWDGTIADIDDLRCDGLVELCYEYNGYDAWGRKDGASYNYSILSFLDEHNESWGFWEKDLQPATQCAHESTHQGTEWGTTLTSEDLCEPIGHSGDD